MTQTVKITHKAFFCIQALKTRFMFHALSLKAVTQKTFHRRHHFFTLFYFSLCATGNHHMKTVLFMFSPVKAGLLFPFAHNLLKTCHFFNLIDLDLQESPPCPAICSADKVCRERWWGWRGGGAESKEWEYTDGKCPLEMESKGKKSRGLLLTLAPVKLKDVCGREGCCETVLSLRYSTRFLN